MSKKKTQKNGEQVQHVTRLEGDGVTSDINALPVPGLGCIVMVTTARGDTLAASACWAPGVRCDPGVGLVGLHAKIEDEKKE